MRINSNKIKGIFWIIPGLVAFFIALIPTLTYQWPLTFDIFVHIHIAQVYGHYGLTFIDPTLNPPNGTPIGYPPLFSLLLLFLTSILKINYFEVARLLQPIFAFSIVLSVSYVAKKFYGDIAGISAGFLVLSSYLFSQILTPLPQTLVLILVPLAVYTFYKSVMDEKYSYALISSLLFLIVIFTHQATTLILFLVITAIAIILGVYRRKIRFFTSYAVYLSLPIIIALLGFVAALLIAPAFVSKIFNYGLTSVLGYSSSLPINQPIGDLKYVAYLGIVLIFAGIGAVVAIKRRENKDLFLFIWILVIFIISKSYWFGVNVYTLRLLIFLLLPLSILGGMGLSYLYLEYKIKNYPLKRLRSVLLIAIFLFSSLFALSIVIDPNFPDIPKYDLTTNNLTNPQIVPPSSSDLDMAAWFNEYGNKNKSVLITNIYSGRILSALTQMPIATINASAPYYLNGKKTTNTLTSSIQNSSIGYLVYDKRLKFSSSTSDSDVFYQDFIYYSVDPHTLIPRYAHIVHENADYIICEID